MHWLLTIRKTFGRKLNPRFPDELVKNCRHRFLITAVSHGFLALLFREEGAFVTVSITYNKERVR